MDPHELKNETEVILTEITETTESILDTEAKNVNSETSDAIESTSEFVSSEKIISEDIIAEETATETNLVNALTKAEMVEQLKTLLKKEVEVVKNEVEELKQQFYKKVKAEHEEQRKAFYEKNDISEVFTPVIEETEETFKSLFNEFKSRKATLTNQLEVEKERNYARKLEIIEELKKMVESNDDVSAHISRFRELQKEWKSTGQVPATVSTSIWKQYNNYQESFWDLIKINNELREYDFKKNLETKTLFCEAAEKLTEEENVITAFTELQKLHDEWHETGPVSRDLRDQIWNRFKAASAVINKKHQAHFEGIRKLEDQNLTVKNEICDKLEAIEYEKITNSKAWEKVTQEVLNLQEEWRGTGFAPRKVNQKIFDRYRKACDTFFEKKAGFYKSIRAEIAANTEKKKELCEIAEQLKDSTDWKETTEKLIQLQKEWKKTGQASKKYSDELWKRFITACDHFFNEKNKSADSQHSTEAANLNQKKELIKKIETIDTKTNPEEALQTLREYISAWNVIGHVPFREKDKIHKEYRAAIDKQFEKLNVDASQRRLESFKNNLKDMTTKGENKLFRERDKLVKSYEHLKAEISTYENNIGFFTSTSKKGGGLIKDMERKIEGLKDEAKLLEQKIKLIDDNIQ